MALILWRLVSGSLIAGGNWRQPEAMMDEHDDPSPVNALPPAVVALALMLVGVEAVFLAAEAGMIGGENGIGWRVSAVEQYGFFGQILDLWTARGALSGEHLLRFVSYSFIHISLTQLIFVGVFLLALGKFVGEVFRGWAVIAVFLVSSIGGALAYGLILDDPRPLLGGYPAVYGLIGAYTYILWLMSGLTGNSQFAAFRLIAALMGIQLVFTAIFGGSNDWVADLGGFVSGFLLSFVVSPGGITRLKVGFRKR